MKHCRNINETYHPPQLKLNFFIPFMILGISLIQTTSELNFPSVYLIYFLLFLSLLNTEPDGKSSSFLKLWLLSSHKKIVIKNSNFGAGEIVQWLRTLADLPGDLGWIPSTQSCSLQSLVSGDPAPSSGLHRHHAHMWYTDTHTEKKHILKN